MGLEAERKAEAECAQGSAAEPAFGGLPVAKSKSLSSQQLASEGKYFFLQQLPHDRQKSRFPHFSVEICQSFSDRKDQ